MLISNGQLVFMRGYERIEVMVEKTCVRSRRSLETDEYHNNYVRTRLRPQLKDLDV
ncbi:MAG TPA: hypothetical protein VG146_10975 [Verrucomicrobiae bacterium]|nr:hypothetical protein [Verrucomicrobiae bacterium]